MTERIYDYDSHVMDFSAQVVSCTPVDGAFDIILDRSAFFPGGARPMAMPSSSFGIQAPTPYAPQQPYTQSYVPQQPAAQPYAQQPVYQVPAKPAANAKDDLGVPAFLRRGK